MRRSVSAEAALLEARLGGAFSRMHAFSKVTLTVATETKCVARHSSSTLL